MSVELECPPAKRNKIAEQQDSSSSKHVITSLDSFSVQSVLSTDTRAKSVAVSGTFAPNNDQLAVIFAEKQPLTSECFPQLFSSSTKLTCNLSNDIYGQYVAEPQCTGIGRVQLSAVYPATDKHVSKYTDQTLQLVRETPSEYHNITRPFIETQALSKQWVYNILDGRSEADRVIYSDTDQSNGFVVLPDLKWDGKDLHNLYLVAIVRRKDLLSLRDITNEHIPMLKSVLNKGKEAITARYGVPGDQLRVYVHYQPAYYHFHVHFTHIKYVASGALAGRAHLLDDIIDNVETIGSHYYQNRTMTFVLKQNDPLLHKLTVTV